MAVLRRLATGYIEGAELETYKEILERLTAKCYVKNVDSAPHKINQQIIYNAGIMFVLLDVLRRHCHGDGQPVEAVVATFNLLRGLARGFDKVQQEMFLNFDMLVDTDNALDGWQDSMAAAMTEVFTMNHKLCLAVRSHHVSSIMTVLKTHVDQCPQVPKLLEAVAKVEELNLPLKNNQSLIIKSLMEHRDVIISPAFIDDESDPEINRQRIELLEDPWQKKVQLYHCNLVSLLASCAEGENKYIESMCQTIFSIEEVLDVLEHDDSIDPMVKTGYIKFFLWVYINTGEASPALIDADVPSYERVWNSLRQLADVDFMKTPGGISMQESDYIFNALLPLTTKLIDGHYSSEAPPAIRGHVVQTIKLIAKFAELQLEHLSDHTQVSTLATVLALLSSKEPEQVDQGVLRHVERKLQQADAGISDVAEVAEYKKAYSEEIEINTGFNNFALRLQRAYSGANKLHVQLAHCKLKPSEAAALSYCEDEEEDERLPLSPEFQRQLLLFAKHDWNSFGYLPQAALPSVNVLIRSLQAEVDDKSESDTFESSRRVVLLRRSLQIIRAILHNVARVGGEIELLQNDLANCILPVISLLQHDDKEVVREALACLVMLLTNGNKAVQSRLEDYFLSTREEMFFEVIQERIRSSLESLRELRTLRRQDAEQQKQRQKLMGTLTIINKLQHQGQIVETQFAAQNGGTYRPQPTVKLSKAGTAKEGTTRNQMLAGLSDDAYVEDDRRIVIEDDGNIELVLRVLQYMCEGYNMVLKGYIHAQQDNIRSIDLVEQTAVYFGAVIEETSNETIALLIQIVDSLLEFSQGSLTNQRAIFNAHVVDHINTIFRTTRFERCLPGDVAHLRQLCALLVTSLLENNGETTKQMAIQLEETLDIPAILQNMMYYYKLGQTHEDEIWMQALEEAERDDALTAMDVSYALYEVVLRLADFTENKYWMNASAYTPPGVELAPADKKMKDDALLHFSKVVRSVEILRDGQLHKCHFVDQWRGQLSDDIKERLIWSVDRSSPADKIRDFVDKSKVIIADTRYRAEMKRKSWLVRFITGHPDFWNQGLLATTLLLNVSILVAWRVNDNGSYTVFPDTGRDPWFDTVVVVGGSVHLFFCLMSMLAYFFMTPPSLSETIRSIPFMGRLADLLKDESSERTETSLLSPMAFYYFLLVPMSALALTSDGYFYPYHLLHVVVGNDILLRVIQAVTKNGISLLNVAMLLCIIIYIYSFISFAYLRQEFDQDDGYWCNTIWQCFVSSLKFGLLNGGGLGEGLVPESEVWWKALVRSVFDISFFILVTIIGLNLVFGIILDTFSELRDEKYHIEEAQENECFICSLKSYDFERFGNGYKHHIKHEHNMWSYLLFMMHLKAKNPNDYTSHEWFVADLLARNEEARCFPSAQALNLQRPEEDDTLVQTQAEHTRILGEISLQLQQMSSQLRELERRIA
eukprot:TRINITY_DN11178_c0_g1_i2.p1 TRINITY_DN11178_c0_g1~~TRINITY_DN11178_c0_g1_i2.p1  ORF type:complete len:1472 (+),score=415.20 TRINITY_DN11178_c0_g1_i2:98-4417(+)